ncbi:hypothetical protein [Microbacterium sp. LEMMJ01]|uniref:hypothetical protein n=1 Tax=Microbacterium sp. LEMMJ01 TaxID=1978350 RepID=UPI001C0B9F8E|nr:hypothetical protein [Microbacterium sp. LEMMJ01]
MDLEITATPRETLVWAPTAEAAHELRVRLADDGYLVRDADPWELQQLGLVTDGDHLEFDPARILDVTIGPDANASLHALVDDGHTLLWHRWQTQRARKVWGVPVALPHRGGPRAGGTDTAPHFGATVRSRNGLGLKLSRDTYATINKRSSMDRWTREDNPELWDRLDHIYEDAEHRILTDEWCEAQRIDALANYDLNMAHFASLDPGEFEVALQEAVSSQADMVEVTDLSQWDGVPGLYVMVLDEFRQVYVGATNESIGIAKRIRQHWTGQKQFDRLIWGSVETSILSINSFRALDTTRIFAMKTTSSFDEEHPLLQRFPAKFTLNRIIGGRDAARFAGILGMRGVMRTRETPDTTEIVDEEVST